MDFQAIGMNLAVTEIEDASEGLFVSDCVGLEKVKVKSISRSAEDFLRSTEGIVVTPGSMVYIRASLEKPVPYMT